jgi:hypothetical protein
MSFFLRNFPVVLDQAKMATDKQQALMMYTRQIRQVNAVTGC